MLIRCTKAKTKTKVFCFNPFLTPGCYNYANILNFHNKSHSLISGQKQQMPAFSLLVLRYVFFLVSYNRLFLEKKYWLNDTIWFSQVSVSSYLVMNIYISIQQVLMKAVHHFQQFFITFVSFLNVWLRQEFLICSQIFFSCLSKLCFTVG